MFAMREFFFTSAKFGGAHWEYIGFEENGKNEMFERPVLILRKFNKYILWALPLTRSKKGGDFYYRITQGEEDDSVVILSQIRLISSKRLLRKIKKFLQKKSRPPGGTLGGLSHLYFILSSGIHPCQESPKNSQSSQNY